MSAETTSTNQEPLLSAIAGPLFKTAAVVLALGLVYPHVVTAIARSFTLGHLAP